MTDRDTDDELASARARIAELEAAEAETKWHLQRLAAIEDPLERVLTGIWEQMRVAGIAQSWARYLVRATNSSR